MTSIFIASSLASSVATELARVESMFAQATAGSPAAQGLQVVGLAIISFTGVVSVAALVAGMWVLAHNHPSRGRAETTRERP